LSEEVLLKSTIIAQANLKFPFKCQSPCYNTQKWKEWIGPSSAQLKSSIKLLSYKKNSVQNAD